MPNRPKARLKSVPPFILDEPETPGFSRLFSQLIFQPRQFFQRLDSIRPEQLLVVAVLILSLIGFSAVQRTMPAVAENLSITEENLAPDSATLETPTSDPSERWIVALGALGTQGLYWLFIAIVLSEVSLFNGKRPQFQRNLRIAIWASLPFGVMALLQIIFVFGGGKVGEQGFAGFLDEWPDYAALNSQIQSALYALASQFNFFSLWSLVLLYLGARENLKGKRLSVSLAVGMWFSILVLTIALQHQTGLNSPESSVANSINDMPLDAEILPAGEEDYSDVPDSGGF